MRIKVNIGDFFRFPLRDHSGWGIGLVVRKSGSILLGYFWKVKLIDNDERADLSMLNKDNAIWIRQFGIRGITIGEWKIVGSLPNFQMKNWPIPKFIKEVPPLGWYIVTYDDNLNVINEEPYKDHKKTYEQDGVSGYGLVEIKMTQILENKKNGN